MISKISIFNINFDNQNMAEVVNSIARTIEQDNKMFVVTPNVDFIVRIKKDREFKKIIKNADLIIPDGMPIIWLSKLIGQPLKERVTGADLLTVLSRESFEKGFKLFLLGGTESLNKLAVIKLRQKYPNVNIVGNFSPSFNFGEKENKLIIDKINSSGANCVFVALGSPKQEHWIEKHKDLIQANVFIGCGAAIDFAAGKKRAPLWMQNSGLEWLYRLIKEPRRLWKRYILTDSKFIVIAMNEIIKRKLKRNQK
ncbi:WecB/TagA/CpsF family glycosyltransferase [Neobacillus sp. YIM B06451]|uniref:WecB/TagA/CpsF family glycosyltransferase n=1 Tax=Neobacillus sp. YIM B06451 TaxID=3070994 RepID=UPI00292D6825|nr:WecB/TagA/CpsF family glycosyltransferase [Neobacillus sp. YIM B06451]